MKDPERGSQVPVQTSEQPGELRELLQQYLIESCVRRKMISVIEQKKIILNFDESIIQEENFHNKSWHMKGPHYAR